MKITYSVKTLSDTQLLNIDSYLMQATGQNPYAKSFPAWSFNPQALTLTIKVTRAKTHGKIADLLDGALTRI